MLPPICIAWQGNIRTARLYMMRQQVYVPVLRDIFNSVIEICLKRLSSRIVEGEVFGMVMPTVGVLEVCG